MNPARYLNRSSLTIGLLLVSIMFVGCRETTERDCRGFDHPLLANWMSADVGQSIRLTAPDGETRAYRLSSIENSEPAIQYAYGGEPQDVVCYNTSAHLFESTTDGYRIWLIYQQLSKFGESVEQDEFNLRISFTLGDEVPQYSYRLKLSDLQSNNQPVNYARESGDYYADRDYGGTRYMDVIERIKSREHYVFGPDADLQMAFSRVVFARSIGFIEIERVDGKVFSVALE